MELDINQIEKFLKSIEVNENFFNLASQLREKFFQKKVYLRAIIEISNYCIRDCLYCGLRISNRSLTRYRMGEQEIIDVAGKIFETGIKTIVLQSGDDFNLTQTQLSSIISKIKKFFPGLAITLSFGERKEEDYICWRKAGADRYLLKHETADKDLYEKMHPGQSFEKRKNLLIFLRKLGYQIGAGSVVGLPGQNFSSLAQDILFLQKLQPDMVGLGPFLPQRHTPLAKYNPPSMELVLRMLILARLVTGNAHIPVTTAFISSYGQQAVKQALILAANVIMVNFTPGRYRKLYNIYDHKQPVSWQWACDFINDAGLEISWQKADSLKKDNLLKNGEKNEEQKGSY